MMPRTLTITLLAVLLVVPTAVILPPAESYVLHGYHLLDLMLEEMGRFRQLEVDQRSSVEGTGSPQMASGVNETISYLIPGSFRSEFSSVAGDHLHVLSSGRSVTIINQRIVSEKENDFDRYKDIFLFNTRESLKNHLLRLGVAPDVSSVGRYQGALVYVVGAQYPDESVPQLWLDKETFRPVRWLLRPASAVRLQESIEIRYKDWRKAGSSWYPFQVEIHQGDRLLRSIQVARVRTNPKLSRQMFDIAYLKSLYPMGDPVQLGQPESGGKSEVQKTIERFRRLFE